MFANNREIVLSVYGKPIEIPARVTRRIIRTAAVGLAVALVSGSTPQAQKAEGPAPNPVQAPQVTFDIRFQHDVFPLDWLEERAVFASGFFERSAEIAVLNLAALLCGERGSLIDQGLDFCWTCSWGLAGKLL